jgi:hypothetical protein
MNFLNFCGHFLCPPSRPLSPPIELVLITYPRGQHDTTESSTHVIDRPCSTLKLSFSVGTALPWSHRSWSAYPVSNKQMLLQSQQTCRDSGWCCGGKHSSVANYCDEGGSTVILGASAPILPREVMTVGRFFPPLWLLSWDQATQDPTHKEVDAKDICVQWVSQSPDLEDSLPHQNTWEQA